MTDLEKAQEALKTASEAIDALTHAANHDRKVLGEKNMNGHYVKALQENLAEAEQELMSAITAEAGEDLMKVSNITEGWEDMLKAVKDRDDKKVGDKWKTSKGEVTKTSTGR